MASIHQEPSVLELWELMQRCLGKPDLAKRVLARFLTQLGGDIVRIGNALDQQDYVTAREVSHRLKGAAANVAAHAIQEQAHALESALQLEMVEQYALVYRGLLAEQERFQAAMNQVCL